MAQTINESHKSMYADCVFCVEANSYEQHVLWEKNQDILTTENSGILVTVGYLGDRPVCISIMCGKINDKRFMFWHATSEVVDYKMIDKWLENHLPQTFVNGSKSTFHCDAQNFHHCIHSLSK